MLYMLTRAIFEGALNAVNAVNEQVYLQWPLNVSVSSEMTSPGLLTL